MKDAQQIMNGHARMALMVALSGSLVFDVDESALVAGQNMDVYRARYLEDKQVCRVNYSWIKVSKHIN